MNTTTTVLGLVPTIINLVKAIEAALPGQGQGAVKLKAVLDLIIGLDAALEPMVPQLSGVIRTLVGLFNATGVFSSKAN